MHLRAGNKEQHSNKHQGGGGGRGGDRHCCWCKSLNNKEPKKKHATNLKIIEIHVICTACYCRSHVCCLPWTQSPTGKIKSNPSFPPKLWKNPNIIFFGPLTPPPPHQQHSTLICCCSSSNSGASSPRKSTQSPLHPFPHKPTSCHNHRNPPIHPSFLFT